MPDLDAPVVRSASDDVFANLALEDYLFQRLKPGERRLFLWRNRDAVVLGRYQNPWLECDLAALRADGVDLARRQSGGGTVWHDPGNLCFTFFGPPDEFDRRENIQTVIRALASLGIAAETNDRLDLLLGGKKISGSAFRQTAAASFHHGTLLIRADLARLARYLRGDVGLTRSKGIKSVRSPVANLADEYPECGPEDVEQALAAAFLGGRPVIEAIDPERDLPPADFAPRRERLCSREWVLGASPPFQRRWPLRIDGQEGVVLVLNVEGGRIRGAEMEGGGLPPPEVLGLVERLIGTEYSGPPAAGDL